MDSRMDWMDELMDGWKDGLIGGWIEWTNGWM